MSEKYNLTELEIKELEEIIISGSENHYQTLGLKIFEEYNKSNYTNRIAYIDSEVKDRDRDLWHKSKVLINQANTHLSHPQKKRIYDLELKSDNEKKIIEIIKLFVEKDKEMDKEERETVEEKGKSFGFELNEINKIIEEQKIKLGFKETNLSKNAQNASTVTTSSGYPKLEITNNTTYKQKGEFVFDNVKLTETRREVITIKNGGGGTLDASAVWTKKWIEVVPDNIHQSNLPQDVTIIINPSKDPSLKNGAATIDTLNLRYASGSNTVNVPINIKLSIEGHYSLVDRLSGYAALIAGAIAFFTLIYLFNINHFSGWAIFGFVVSAIAIGIGFIAAMEESDKNLLFLYIIPGEIILLITSLTVFLLFLTITVTWFVAKLVFKRYTFRNEFIFVIPVCTFLLFLFFLIGGSNLDYYSGNFRSNRTVKTTKPISNPPVSVPKPVERVTESVGRTGYIGADDYANIRNGPSVNDGIITSKNRGETVYVMERDLASGWYKISYTDKENVTHYGYVSDKLISFDFIPKTSILDGKWICVSSYMETEGLVVSFSNNVGTVYSLPTERKSNRTVGQVLWKDFRPEQNWLNVYVPLSGGYLNNEVTFKDSNNTIRFMNGDVYKRFQPNSSPKNESNNYKPPTQVNPVIDKDNSKEEISAQDSTIQLSSSSKNGDYKPPEQVNSIPENNNHREENSVQNSTIENEVLLSDDDDNFFGEYGNFKDSRDSHIYKWVKIGSQIWMAENLKVTKYQNGDPIPNITNSGQWSKLLTGAYSNYNNNESNAIIYGRIYNGYAANDARKICPCGWRVPTEADWRKLENFLGGTNVAGGKLKEPGLAHWQRPNSGSNSKSVFLALPGGGRNYKGDFGYISQISYWWGYSGNDDSPVRSINYNSTSFYKEITANKYGFYVRCIKE